MIILGKRYSLTEKIVLKSVTFLFFITIYIIVCVIDLLYPPRFSSHDWRAVSPESVTSVDFIPLKYRNYSNVMTITKEVHIDSKSLLSELQECLDGSYTYRNFGRVRFSVPNRFNMVFRTKEGEFWFRIVIDEESEENPISVYSEIHPDTIRKPGDEQRLYDSFAASERLAKVIFEILRQRDVHWKQVDRDVDL